jgi:protein gp37
MGATKIEWTATLGRGGELYPGFTFNPWVGCHQVSAGCANCYAEALMDKRYARVRWGKGQPRQRTTASYWRQPIKWNAQAEQLGVRLKVFCASLADVFDEEVDDLWRTDLFNLIAQTPALDWLLLTKRAAKMRAWMTDTISGVVRHAAEHKHLPSWNPDDWPPGNVWLGVSVENQATADWRIPELLATPAVLRFVSYEPALAPVDFTRFFEWTDQDGARVNRGPHWVIVGGESGPKARPFDVAWARSTIKQCKAAGVACFVKQLGAHVIDRNDVGFDADMEHYADTGVPTNEEGWPSTVEVVDAGCDQYQGAPVRVRLADRKGGNMTEWPWNLRMREFPQVETDTRSR